MVTWRRGGITTFKLTSVRPEGGGTNADYIGEGQRSGHESGVKNVRLAIRGSDRVSDLGT